MFVLPRRTELEVAVRLQEQSVTESTSDTRVFCMWD